MRIPASYLTVARVLGATALLSVVTFVFAGETAAQTKTLPSKPTTLLPPPNLQRAAPAPAPAPAPPPATSSAPPPPPPIPAVKAKLSIPETLFTTGTPYAGVTVTGSSVMLLNGIRINPNSPLWVSVSTRDASAFPNGTMTIVLSGSAAEPIASRTMVLSGGGKSVSCVLPPPQSSWRCAIEIPTGQGQRVTVSADTRAIIGEISVE